mmetsp:Transcript_39430/g.104708  ORF Transcript_39430/g.104708 Transcript_39430/m.104708 type:complete len:134 (-) Transcript_39430:377-778(-)
MGVEGLPPKMWLTKKCAPKLNTFARVAFLSSVSTISRTRISSQLEQRMGVLKALKKNSTRPVSELVERSPSESRVSIEIPLASDAALAEEYLSYRGGVRFGKILEDIDLFAAYVGLTHCNDGNPDTFPNMLVS